ncbi:hypothetical protein AK812_SmicGene26857 [Symbiodinium microadriaticum]|uniref:Uncharacterized protein n=1 Tax=Symbiodinium microadriaticum TaxID=2951 RepID=A0A1Q9D8E4_SYMMI|nr:hypothetical protein AK812_SmicGene26857 [Symbiodinium microadriaticum]
MLDTAAYYVARGFASDVNKAFEASLPGSPWMERMQADKDGFYHELQKIEKMRSPAGWRVYASGEDDVSLRRLLLFMCLLSKLRLVGAGLAEGDGREAIIRNVPV